MRTVKEKWVKYFFTCDTDDCDSLIEFTAKDRFNFNNGVIEMNCPCGKKLNYISKEEVR